MPLIPVILLIGLLIYILYRLLNSKTSRSSDYQITNYYASWCGYSQKFLPIWNEFKLVCAKHYPQVTCNEVICDQENKSCKTNGINAYPTIVFSKPNTKPLIEAGYKQLEDLLKLSSRFFAS